MPRKTVLAVIASVLLVAGTVVLAATAILDLRVPGFTAGSATNGANHQVSRRVLGAGELDDLGAITHDAEGERAERVRGQVRGAFAKDAVPQDRPEK